MQLASSRDDPIFVDGIGSRTERPDEMLVLPLSGSCSVRCGHEHFSLAGRISVFDRVRSRPTAAARGGTGQPPALSALQTDFVWGSWRPTA